MVSDDDDEFISHKNNFLGMKVGHGGKMQSQCSQHSALLSFHLNVLILNLVNDLVFVTKLQALKRPGLEHHFEFSF